MSEANYDDLVKQVAAKPTNIETRPEMHIDTSDNKKKSSPKVLSSHRSERTTASRDSPNQNHESVKYSPEPKMKKRHSKKNSHAEVLNSVVSIDFAP